MGKLWTGTEFKENPSPTEVQAGLDHLARVLRNLRQQVRPDLPLADADALLKKIDQHVDYYNANAAALNEYEVRAALEERAEIIDALQSASEGEASKTSLSEQRAGH